MINFRISIIAFVFTLFICCAQSGKGDVQPVPRDTTITEFNSYSELFIDSSSLESYLSAQIEEEDRGQRIRNFYNNRNYGYAWFNNDGLTVQAEGFYNSLRNYAQLLNDTTMISPFLQHVFERLFDEPGTRLARDTLVRTELSLTHHFFRYVQDAYGGRADPEQVQWHIPQRKLDPLAMLDSLLNVNPDDWKPLTERFHRLFSAVMNYRSIVERGGWQKIEETERKFRKGNSSPVITQIKVRLHQEDIYSAYDTSENYSDTLEPVIKAVQRRYGMKPTGVIDSDLVEKLNVPADQRLRQMLINLERMKWMPEQPENFIFVNIPAYRLQVVEKGSEVLAMDVVVGKAANRTVIFSDQLKYVVFSPYWNIPKSIIRNEIVPAMNRNQNYLDRNNMEIVRYEDGLPIIRQRPGRDNSLGRVKFIFPNQYNIYLHDTPAKSLFNQSQRAFSHGCIRVEKPFELAKYLLREKESWTEGKIREAMSRSDDLWVTLDKEVPVFIAYFTAWVDKQGWVHFREDIYDHDDRLSEHLFKS